MDKNKISFCGLYCGACLCNIAWETDSLQEIAERSGKPQEALTCTNCKTALHQDCCFVVCCIEKGLQNCSECPEMPCTALKDFANDGVYYHAPVIANLLRLKEVGEEKWLAEQEAKFTCGECGNRLSWSSTVCLKCGKQVSNSREEIDEK